MSTMEPEPPAATPEETPPTGVTREETPAVATPEETPPTVATTEETPRRAPRRYFSLLVTIACSIVVAVYIGMPVGPLLRNSVSPLTQLDRPEDSLERLVTRELDLREAMQHGVRWEWRLYRVLSGGDEPTSEARDWYEELADNVDSLSAELHLAILQAESGEVDRVQDAETQWKSWGESGERMAAWLHAAYLDPAPDSESGRAAIGEVREELEPDWFSDTLVARIAARAGDERARSQALAGIAARGRTLQIRLRLMMAFVLLLLALGVIASVGMLTRRASLPVADAPVPPAWSFGDGYALFVRALGAPQAIVLAIAFLLRRETPLESVLIIAADLPVLWWIARYLRFRNASIPATFGLAPRRAAWPRLIAVALALIAVALVSDTLIDTGSAFIGLKSHWADGFSEDILWDPGWLFTLDVFSVTVWAPVIEEATFRGLLFATLRTRLPLWPSALISAVVFALPHGYAAAGSVSVLVSGLLWAWSYERTRSLLPGLLAHSANNIMSTLWVLALLRM